MPSDAPNHSRFDLRLERTIDAPVALIWKVWTDPKHVKKWWAPAPWITTECEIDARPGGVFRALIRSPEAQEYPHVACFLEVIKNQKMVMTNALGPGYRPAGNECIQDCSSIPFTSILMLREQGRKTHYSIVVLHKDEADRKRHEEMGFHEGWNTCLDQLIEVVGRLSLSP